MRLWLLALAAGLLLIGIPRTASAKGEAVAVLLVGRQDAKAQMATEKALIGLLKAQRKAAGLDAKGLPILVYHFDRADERRYCERRLGLRGGDLFVVAVARLAADRLPSEILESRSKVTNGKAAAAELFPVALARIQGPKSGVGGVLTTADKYARESAAGDAAFARQDFTSALAHYDAAGALRPMAWRNDVRRATTLIALGRPVDAQKAALKAIGLAPTEAPPHGLLGLSLAAQGQDDLAQTELNNAIKLAPEWAVPHAWLAQFAMGRRQWELAIEEANAAEKLDPKSALPAYVLGTVDLQHWRLASAREWLEKATHRQGDFAAPYEMLGWTLVLQADYGAAATVYQSLVDHAPGSPAGYVGLALARYYADDFTGSLDWIEKARTVAPNDSLVRAVEGFALAGAGRGDDAMAAARAALDSDPRNPNAYEALADAQTALHQFVPALENYRRAEELLHGWPEPQLLFKWALCARDADRRDVSREVARRLLDKYPGNAWSTQAEALAR